MADNVIRSLICARIETNEQELIDTIFDVIKKIIELENGVEINGKDLFDVSKYTLEQLHIIYDVVFAVCLELCMDLKIISKEDCESENIVNIIFIKNNRLICPRCLNKLTYLEPDGFYMFCKECDGKYKNYDYKFGVEGYFVSAPEDKYY